MKNNDKNYSIYLRSIKKSVPVTKEEFDNYYRDINAYRIKQQRHKRCVCPSNKRLWCDMDCLTCEFFRYGDSISIESKNPNDEFNDYGWLNKYLNVSSFDDIDKTVELNYIFDRIKELMPEAIDVGAMRVFGYKDVEIAKALNVKNTTLHMRLIKIKSILEKEFPEYF